MQISPLAPSLPAELGRPFQLGSMVRVLPSLHQIHRNGTVEKVEPRLMRVLCLLAAQPGEVVSREDLLDAVWPDGYAQDEALTQAISKLRRALGDRARDARMIETIPKAGYRLIAPVEIEPDASDFIAPSPSAFLPSRLRPAIWGGAVLAGLALAVLFWPTADPAPANPQPIPLTTFRGQERDPAIAPDGQRIAFAWDQGESASMGLFVKQIGAEEPVPLTDPAARDRHPAWSPDGRLIAFTRHQDNERHLYVIPAIGGAERLIARLRVAVSAPLTWAPDGQSVVLSDRARPNDPNRLVRVALDGSSEQPLTDPSAGSVGDAQPVFSPNGQRLAFVRSTLDGIADVYLLDLPDSTPRRVTTWEREVLGLAWSHDGRALLAASLLDGGYRLWRIPLDGGEPTTLYVGTEPLFGLAFDAANGQLVYTASDIEVNIWQHGLDDAISRPIIMSTTWDSHPRLSPDGLRLAFASVREVAPEIWVSEADGRSPRRLTHFAGPYVGPPAWSPEGTRLVFDARAEGQADLYTVAAEGGPVERLTDTPHDEVHASWSHDGMWIYYASNQDGAWQTYALRPSDGVIRQITHWGGYAALERPDGAVLYFTRHGEDGLWQKPLPDGPETRVLAYPSASAWGAWDVTRAGLVVVREAEEPELVRIAPDTNRERVLARFPAVLPGNQRVVSMAPDGASFVYSHVERFESDLKRVVWSAPL
ncbi:MAG: hypothetical protein HKN04_11520 [Rhodothermaceae bacterium]|nr:hypothetical protein [Rhodothermaceae bacterium]